MSVVDVIENSFLKEIIREDVTDISFNGEEIFYLSNLYGRCKFEKNISSNDAYILLRKISDYANIPFSLANPILDLTFDIYRINATFLSVSKKNKTNVVTFSIRISSNKLHIRDDGKTAPSCIFPFLTECIKNKCNILISGPTSSGKTEFQKFLLTLFAKNSRIVIIDTINELDYKYENDIDTTYFVLEKNTKCNMDDLLETSLRYNPDYVLIAESRGAEFQYVISSALAGVSTITTIHSRSVNQTIERCINMMQMTNKQMNYDDLKKVLFHTVDLIIQLDIKHDKDGVVRFLSEVGFLENNQYLSFGKDDLNSSNMKILLRKIKEKRSEK